MKEIPLRARDGSTRAVALVDDEDFDDVNAYRWQLHRNGYAVRGGGKEGHEYMHRRIVREAEVVDHINGNRLDNRRSNLRAATQSQNLANRPMPPSNTSGYKGVTFYKRTGRWMAQTKVKGKLVHLGYFDDPAEAHAAYVAGVQRLYGEFARTA